LHTLDAELALAKRSRARADRRLPQLLEEFARTPAESLTALRALNLAPAQLPARSTRPV